MNQTLFIGGASPMGSCLSYCLKKNVQTHLTIVDIAVKGKKLIKMHASNIKLAKKFIKEDQESSFDHIIINLYELLDAKTMEYCKENGNLFLSLLNKVIVILQHNPDVKVSILLNSYQYYYPEGHYQVAFNLYNELAVGFIEILSKLQHSTLKIVYLPNVLISGKTKGNGFVDIAINAIEKSLPLAVSEGFRDYVMWKDIESPLLNVIIEESGQVVEITSGSCYSNKLIYELLAEKNSSEVKLSFFKQPYQFKHFQEWNPSKAVTTVLVPKSIKEMLSEYIGDC